MLLILRKVRNDWRSLLMTLAVCGVVACSSPPRSAAQKVEDDAITARVEAALTATPNQNYSKVLVYTYDGVVHLSGLVWSNSAIVTAVRVARSVPGVQRVNNSLELVSSQTPQGR